MTHRRMITAAHVDYSGELPRPTVYSIDPPGPGGAHHVYELVGIDLFRHEPLMESAEPLPRNDTLIIPMQYGGVPEHGVNGATNEALLAIVAHRLRCFQAGPFPCKDNDRALAHVEWALEHLHARTRERMARGVEGGEEA